MKVKATWNHVIQVTREIEVDEDAFNEWMTRRYGAGADRELALTVWIESLDAEQMAEVFSDWRISETLPSDFELQYSDVIDAAEVSPKKGHD